MTEVVDYVVVGGGTAGAVIARRLSDAGAEVMLVEAGPSGEYDGRILTLARWGELYGTELDYDYEIEPQLRGNEQIRYTTAKMLGGGSAHNTCIAFRAPRWDMEAWEESGAAGWGPDGTDAAFDRVLSQVHRESSSREHPWAQAFIEGAEQAGLPVIDMSARDIRAGAGWFSLNKRGPLRESSAAAYLFPLAERAPNLIVRTDEMVLRVLLDHSGDAIGVETARGRILARQETILCGGSFGSPKLLQLSGIGAAKHLKAVGVAPLVDLPGVGEHLLDHPEGIVVWEAATEGWSDSSHWETGLFLDLGRGEEGPEVMAHFSTSHFNQNTIARGYPNAEHVFSLHPNVTRPRSQGTVRLRSADPADAPLIDPRYFTDAEGYDERVLVEGIEFVRELGRTPALERIIKRELAPGPGVLSAAELAEYARLTGNTVYHPAGTCKMGALDDGDAVVSPDLRVRDVGRLRVADASVFPSMTTVNPCLTVMMIGERCAEFILDEHSTGALSARAQRSSW